MSICKRFGKCCRFRTSFPENRPSPYQIPRPPTPRNGSIHLQKRPISRPRTFGPRRAGAILVVNLIGQIVSAVKWITAGRPNGHPNENRSTRQADVTALQAACFCACRTSSVICLLELPLSLSHVDPLPGIEFKNEFKGHPRACSSQRCKEYRS